MTSGDTLDLLRSAVALRVQGREVPERVRRELELVENMARAIADRRFARTYAVVVEDHGVYVWGDDIWETKRHTETYHFLFEATVARHDRRREDRSR